MKVRQSKNQIKELHTEDDKILTKHEDIANEAIGFYQALLGSEDPYCTGGDLHQLKALFDFQLSEVTREALIQPVTAEECRLVLFSSPNNKSPGPDGYTVEFYKSAWSIVGYLITRAI
ncbi:hypothetical protein SLE2022_015850 [Rubroshorea leprosula]